MIGRFALLLLLNGCGSSAHESTDSGPAGDDGSIDTCPAIEPTWTTESVDSELQSIVGISLALDSAGKAHIAYGGSRGDVSVIRHASNVSGDWHVEEIPEWDPEPWPSLAVDDAGTAHVAFAGTNGLTLKYATNAGGAWTLEPVVDFDPGEPSGRVSLALDSAGTAHIAYFRCLDWETCSANHAIAVTTNEADAWRSEDIALGSQSVSYSLAGARGAQPSLNVLVVSAAGTPHVLVNRHVTAIEPPSDFSYLQLFSRDGSSWSDSEVAQEFQSHEFEALAAVDDAGAVHVVFMDAQGRLEYSRQTEDHWSTTPVDLLGGGGVYGFAVDRSGAAHLSYRTVLPSSRYATNACGEWRIFDVGDDGPVGPLAIHADGRVSIAFERQDPGEGLWYATSER